MSLADGAVGDVVISQAEVIAKLHLIIRNAARLRCRPYHQEMIVG